jgi:hypothetical protein
VHEYFILTQRLGSTSEGAQSSPTLSENKNTI